MKLSKKEKSYIYDRVKWYGYDLGSTKDFIVKLYFFEEEDYSENEDGTIAAYYTSMNTLFNILADRGIEYKEAIDIDGCFYVEFSSKEIYKYIKYDINKGKKKRKLTPLERRLEREYIERLEDYHRNNDIIDSIIAGRATYIPEENLLSTIDIDYIPSDEIEDVIDFIKEYNVEDEKAYKDFFRYFDRTIIERMKSSEEDKYKGDFKGLVGSNDFVGDVDLVKDIKDIKEYKYAEFKLKDLIHDIYIGSVLLGKDRDE